MFAFRIVKKEAIFQIAFLNSRYTKFDFFYEGFAHITTYCPNMMKIFPSGEAKYADLFSGLEVLRLFVTQTVSIAFVIDDVYDAKSMHFDFPNANRDFEELILTIKASPTHSSLFR